MTDGSGQVGAINTPSWHIPAGFLAAYAMEDVSAADAWSAESHLARCGQCRADLAGLVASGSHQSVIDEVRTRVLSHPTIHNDLTPAIPARRPTLLHTGPLLLLRGPWFVAVLTAAVVTGAAQLVAAGTSSIGGGGLMLALLAPLIPLAGVGLCYRTADRGWAEAVLATPVAGLRLVLWRVLAVTAVAFPMTLLIALLTHSLRSLIWLLPAAGLSAVSLALGTRIELGRATALVASLWAATVVAPTLVTRHLVWDVFSHVAQGVWGAIVITAVIVIFLRREKFERLPAWRPAGV